MPNSSRIGLFCEIGAVVSKRQTASVGKEIPTTRHLFMIN